MLKSEVAIPAGLRYEPFYAMESIRYKIGAGIDGVQRYITAHCFRLTNLNVPRTFGGMK